MARRGRKRRLDLESEYWQLIGSGVGTVEACRRLRIGRKTGYRWRAESGGLPRAQLMGPKRPSIKRSQHQYAERYLSLLERHRIATLTREGMGIREIARMLGRAPSTVSRELRRNVASYDRCYDGDLAHARARERARRPRHGRLLVDAQLRQHVQDKLGLEWSPEQIAAWLRAEFPATPHWHVCHETIYQSLYLSGRSGLSRQLTKRLRTGRPMRKRRRRSKQRQARFRAPSKLIDQRPAVVQLRQRIGDWEGDLIVGRSSRSAIATLVDRTSRYLRLVPLPKGHGAQAVREALVSLFTQLPSRARMTLTWDQGSEMAHHDRIAEHLNEGVYFAPPASPWLRGTNENTNGLVRQYFPKGTDLSEFTPADLARVEERLNNRPRKTLGWKTPAQIFNTNMRS